jgi:SHS2 domain-containing protein
MTRATAGFELRDHTADIAVYAWADSVEELFRKAAEGLYATIGDLQTKDAGERERFRVDANDLESLLHDFLDELLYRFEMHGRRFADFTFDRLDDHLLEVDASARPVDAATSVLDREVKAVTYHDLKIVERDGRFEVTVILDI